MGTPGRLAPGVDLTAYRIVQEALTNTIRHAHAARATVTLRYEPGYVTVSVADSGPGHRGLGAGRTRLGTGWASRCPGPGSGWPASPNGSPRAAASLSLGPTPAGGFSVLARLPAR